MADRDTGGQAFPTHPILYSSEDSGNAQGMSLRDWFAGQVAGALVRRSVSLEDWARVAPVSYEIADAMLEARKQ